MSKDEGAGLSGRWHGIEIWADSHAPPLSPTSWSVRLCSALNGIVQAEGQPCAVADISGEAMLDSSGLGRVIHLSPWPCSHSGLGRPVWGGGNRGQ